MNHFIVYPIATNQLHMGYQDEDSPPPFTPEYAQVGIAYIHSTSKLSWYIRINGSELTGVINYSGDPEWADENGPMIAETIYNAYHGDFKKLKINSVKVEKKTSVQEYTW